MANSLIDAKLFAELQQKIELDALVRQDLDHITEKLEKRVSLAQGILSKVHSTPRSQYPKFLPEVEKALQDIIVSIDELEKFACHHPYYKYNFKWTRSVQDAITVTILYTWLGGNLAIAHLGAEAKPAQLGRLLTLEEIGMVFRVPVNVKDQDTFHITIEEYLFSLVTVTDELARLAMNSVTLGDYDMAVQISGFIKDLFAGFQLLNLKNSDLRKRVDAIKYSVKKVEDVVYDLTLRNMIPKKVADSSV